MSYFIRILGKANPTISVDQLKNTLTRTNISATIETEEGTDEDWTQIIIKDDQERTFVLIEKNLVLPGQLGAEELEEFRENISDCYPKSAVKWLNNFFDKVKVIYAFQILSAIDGGNNWETLDAIKTEIWEKTKGIFQADNEGFSNENGYHILWQFEDDVTGNWNMAVRNLFGGWINFSMDLGNLEQREAFWKGKVHKDARRLK